MNFAATRSHFISPVGDNIYPVSADPYKPTVQNIYEQKIEQGEKITGYNFACRTFASCDFCN